MKRKLVTSILTLVSVTAALAGCGHQHTFSNDWTSNSSKHWHQATCGHNLAINIEEHVDSNNDGLCDVCNWNMSGQHIHSFSTSWSTNDTEHWHECSCGEKSELNNHVDNNNDEFCDICGCAITVPIHKHTFSPTWTTSPTQHWHQATCGHNVTDSLGNHIDSDGDSYCDVCNYKITNPDPGDYYSTISSDMSGQTLLNALKEIIKKNVNVNYDWTRFEAADEDSRNTANIVTIYARTSIAKGAHSSGSSPGWNREHSFPQSKMSGDCEKDNHIIFASDCKVNGTRSNFRLGELDGSPNVKDSYGKSTPCILGKKNGEQMFDPGDTIAKGMVARATMYASVLYGLNITTNFESYETLLKWHLNYQPEESDYRRNEAVFKRQKNRNPFVDHPEYACKIWGTQSAETKSLCGI